MGGVLMIVLWIVLGRFWEVELFGYFNYLFAYISIVGIFFDFGLDVLLTKLISKNKHQGIPRHCWKLKQQIFLIVFLLFFITGYILSFSLDSLLCLLVGSALLSFNSYFNAIFRARDQLHLEAKIGLLQKFIFIGSSLIGVIVFDQEIFCLALAYLISHLLALLITLVILTKKQWLTISNTNHSVEDYLHQSWPLFVSALLAILSLRLDIFLLQWLKNPEQVGFYTAAMRLFEGVIVISTAFLAVIFPKFVAKSHDLQALFDFFKHTAGIFSTAAVAIIIPGLFIIPTAITLLYGVKFLPSIILLQVVLPALLLVFLSSLSANLLVAMGKQLQYMKILTSILFIQIIVNIVAIHLWGTMGAIIGFWIREILLFILLWTAIKNIVFATKNAPL
jgi:O-antigen/teichoic acid export membrane protein